MRPAVRILAFLAIYAALWTSLRGWAQDSEPPGAIPPPAVRHSAPQRVGETAASSLVLALARVCAGEAGWQVDSGDCAAIVHVLSRRAAARGLTLERMAQLYSGRHVGIEASPRPWVAHLTLDGAEPDEWPASASWPRHRDAWLEIVEHVRAVLRGDVNDPCGGRSAHWGAPYGADLRRAIDAGWVREDCGRTRNAFWSLPGRGNAS